MIIRIRFRCLARGIRWPRGIRRVKGREVAKMDLLMLQRYLAVGAILFGIGLIGFMTRRNLIVLFLSTELMFQGIAVNFIAFGRFHMGAAFFHGQSFVVFLLVILATEASLGLGLVVLLFRRKNALDADAWRELKG